MRILILLLLSALGPALSQAEVIVIRGSDSLGAKLMPSLCESYKIENPGIEFDITAEGSSSAFAALLNGQADIGMSSREIDALESALLGERGLLLNKSTLACDALLIAVNKRNPVDQLSKAQVEGIFAGDISNWAEVAPTNHPISIYTRNTASANYNDFRRLAMRGREYTLKTIKATGGESSFTQVARDEFGVTYIGLAYGGAPGIKTLKIETVEPPHPDYPYYKKQYLFTLAPPKDSVAKFIRWCVNSREAKTIISRIGFIPAETIQTAVPESQPNTTNANTIPTTPNAPSAP